MISNLLALYYQYGLIGTKRSTLLPLTMYTRCVTMEFSSVLTENMNDPWGSVKLSIRNPEENSFCQTRWPCHKCLIYRGVGRVVEPLIGALLSLACFAARWASLWVITILPHMHEKKETPVSTGDLQGRWGE